MFDELYCLIFVGQLYLYFVLEVEDASPSHNEEVLAIPNLFLFPKREDVPLSNFPGFSGPCKLQPDTQGSSATSFNSQGISQKFLFIRIKYIIL